MTLKTTDRQRKRAQLDFIEALSAGATVADAAKYARTSRSLLYKWRGADETFAHEWKLAFRRGTYALEAEAQRRAIEGVERPVYYGGVQCGVTREFNDVLLIFLLKARDPMRFCDRARSAAISYQWAAENAARNEAGCAVAANAILALERLASEKAATALRSN